MPSPMPDLNSPQFPAWLQQQPPQIQQAILRELGMDAASGNAPSASQGGFAPSLTEFAYDTPSMLGGIPMSTNSKGEANPFNVETQQKRLNYAQDMTGSAGLGNNMLSWMTGGQGTDPSAWQPTRVGIGTPVQFKGQSGIDAFAESGGDDWQSYIAARIKGGDTPAMAITKLKKMVQGTDETGGVSPASPDFLASLPSSADYESIPGQPEPDVKTDRGFATLFNVKDITGFANDLFKGVADDRALQSTSWQDPKTGQWYSGYEDKKTEQMEAADKLGLAYPTQSYADDDYVHAYQQRMLGSDDTYDAMDRQQRSSDAQGFLDAAQRKATDEQDYMTAARRAYDVAHPAPVPQRQPFSMPTPPQVGKPISETPFGQAAAPGPVAAPGAAAAPSPTEGLRVVSTDSTGNPILYATAGGQLITPDGVSAVDNMVTPKNTRLGDIPNAVTGVPTKTDFTPRDLDLSSKVHYTRPEMSDDRARELRTGEVSTKPRATKNKAAGTLQGLGSAYALGSTNAPTRKEVEEATRRKTTANQVRSDAQQAYYKSQFLTDDEMNRAKLATTMRYLASQGRSPMQDQLAARSQTIRNLIGY